MTFYCVGYKLETCKGVVFKLCANIITAKVWVCYYKMRGYDLRIVEWFTHGDGLP